MTHAAADLTTSTTRTITGGSSGAPGTRATFDGLRPGALYSITANVPFRVSQGTSQPSSAAHYHPADVPLIVQLDGPALSVANVSPLDGEVSVAELTSQPVRIASDQQTPGGIVPDGEACFGEGPRW